jgi:flavin reductase (DIM6/NTAB) family NADH-FMN oxidoreductase RutF
MQCVTRRFHQCRRAYSALCPAEQSEKQLQHNLRLLLREIAQPVAVVTTTTAGHDPTTSCSAADTKNFRRHTYHGATLASLNSISLHPHSLLSFTLRLPSRLASALKPDDSHTANTGRSTAASPHRTKRAVINYLSASQAHIAHTFARGDVSRDPFAVIERLVSGGGEGGGEGSAYFLDEHGVPVLKDCIGAVSCDVLVPGIPLSDLDHLRRLPSLGTKKLTSTWASEEPEVDIEPEDSSPSNEGSELFILRATNVLYGYEEDESELRKPLLYNNRTYRTLDSRILPVDP